MSTDPVSTPPGLPTERTALAWQRSALSLAGVSVVVARITYEAVGPLALVVLAIGLGHTAVLFATSQRHYRERSGMPAAPRGARLARVNRVALRPWSAGVHSALLSVQVVLLGVCVLADVLTHAPAT